MILCTSGGYKAITAFSVMYAQINALPCLYTFEGSSHAFELMNIPIGYAITALDEEISILKAITDNEISDKSIDFKSLPQWVQDTKELAPMLVKSYEKGRKQVCGTGIALFDRLRRSGKDGRGKKLAEHLEGLLADNWAELWLGDQIPETVEHSRRHSKRLMEFAANLFRCAEPQMKTLLDPKKPELLALLIAGIYLHDIGHTALSFPVIPSKDETPFPLGLFPSSVREIHHLLTASLLEAEVHHERYFGDKHNDHDYKFLKICVPFLAAHHRGYTTLKDSEGNPSELISGVGYLVYPNFRETLRSLNVRFEEFKRNKRINSVSTEELLNVAALLRIIDGCDVQADRVVSNEYLKARLIRTKDEAKFLSSQFKAYCTALPSRYIWDIAELEGLTATLEIESVSKGDFIDKDKRIENKCKAIYKEVFADLKELKQKCKGGDVWGIVQKDNAALFAGLSLANRIAFKWEQFLHFYKHQCVGFILPVKGQGSNEVKINVFPSEQNKGSKNIDEIIKDINKEYNAVKSILDGKITFKAVSTDAKEPK